MIEEAEVLTVSEANRLARAILETGTPDMLCVEGEISNITYHVSGHLYFTLKDDLSSMKAVAFSYRSKGITSDLAHGDQARLFGRMTIYEVSGQYQFMCSYVEKQMKYGVLYKKFLELKEKLMLKGYFDAKFKKPIPFAKNIGIVTSEKGAVIRDVVSTAKARGKVNIFLFPAQVQGEGAERDIIEGIEFFNSLDYIDVIIICRGGGSFEDLNAFNSELLAEAIFKSEKPIISAVGHETDYVISDFVADLRAATPTQAAVLAVPDKISLKKRLDSLVTDLNQKLEYLVSSQKSRISGLTERINQELGHLLAVTRSELRYREESYVLRNFYEDVQGRELQLIEAENKIESSFNRALSEHKASLSSRLSLLKTLNPINVLSRGYSITLLEGKSLKSKENVSISDKIETRLPDGTIVSVVTEIY